MQSIKRDLAFVLSFCVLIFVCAVALGGPLIQRAPDPHSIQVGQQGQLNQLDPSSTFTGTIIMNGDEYCLRNSSGQVYGLVDAESAQAFTGQDVKVIGQLEEQGTLIRVEHIQGAQS